jgi:hypothetical protein
MGGVDKLHNVLVIAIPSYMYGGGIRTIRSLKEYTKHFNAYLFLPWGIWYDRALCLELSNTLERLKREGVKLGGVLQEKLHSDNGI